MALLERQPMSPVAADAPRVEPFASGTSIGRYRIISLAGSGAMGDVYRAHDRVLDRDVALKVLPPNLVHDRDRVRRFAQEARAASALSHPHIVTIYEVGHARPSMNVQPIAGHRQRRNDVHYIAMEFIDGQTLRHTLDNPVPISRRVELLIEVADGLTKAHGAGIIHRDLKPENIIVAKEGYAKIVDFGLAKLVDGDGWSSIGADSPTLALTHKGEILGTPGYMSPEQVTGGVVDQRSDIFSFGCILYELLAGRQPFDGDSFLDTLHKIVHDDPAPMPNDVPPALVRVALKCLAKNRGGRYETIHDAAVDLKEWLHSGHAPIADSNPQITAPMLKRTSPRGSLIAIAATTIVVGTALFGHRLYSPAPSREEHTIHRITSSGRVSLATISPDGRYVAYVVGDEKNRCTLWLEQIETHSRLQIAPPAESHYAGVTFSRDGNYLYFARYESYPFGALLRVPILGGKPEIIAKDVDTRPTFSPDGKQLAFVRDDWNNARSTIYIIGSDGGAERALASARIPHRFISPAWSPDGKHIVVVEDTKLMEVAVASGEQREIAAQMQFESFRGVTWTPDGSLVASAATQESGDRVRLWRVDPKSGECRAITDELSNVVAPSMTADGSSIAALQIVRQASLFTVDGQANVRQLSSGAGYAGVAWAGDKVIYASSGDGNPDLWAVDPRGGEASRLTTERSTDSYPRPCNDGSCVVYRAGSGNQWSLWWMKPDGSEHRQLTQGPLDGDFAISPDSKTLAWATLERASNEWVLWTMPLAGGPHRRLASRKSVLDEINFTPDGKSILFTGYEDTRVGIFRIAANGGAVTLLTTKASKDATPSPDGQTLACTYDIDQKKHASVGLIPLGDPSHVKTLDLKGSMYRWRDATDISFVHDDNGASNLWVESLDRKGPQKLTNFNEGSIVDYAWSNDGKRAVVAHVVDSVDVVVIQNR